MPDITIKVRDKIAQPQGSPVIVCGNDGYHAIFDLDDEWSSYELITMRVAWTDTFSGQPRHTDVPFIRSIGYADIPAIADAYEVQLGIYAGDIRTSTGARIPCERCVTDGGVYHEDPDPQTYAALLALLAQISQGGTTVGDCTFIMAGVNAGKAGQADFQEVE